MAGGSDHNNKLNLVISVFGREFRLFACQIVLIVFLGSCCLFIIYYTRMLFLSYSAVLVEFLIVPLHPPALGFRFGHDLR